MRLQLLLVGVISILTCSAFTEEENCFFSQRPPHAAYNEPAAYQLGPKPWLFWFDASFIYWDASQSDLDLAVSSTDFSGTISEPQNGSLLFQNSEYNPGFKVGLGLDLDSDHWSGLVEYTWLRYSSKTDKNAPADARGGVGVWILSNWFHKQVNIAAIAISSKWRLNMDVLDAGLTRPFYSGTHLIFAPFGGLRAEWIRQSLSINADIFATGSVDPAFPATSTNRSKSWGLGPHLGLKSEWHLSWGFRFVGDVAASLLFTRYLKVTHEQTPTSSAGGADFVSSFFRHYDCVRGDALLNAGIGWGKFLDCRNYHLDLLATYDFQIFWNQNMMRQLVDASADGTGSSPGHLYLQGLTLRTQLDF